MLFKLDCTSRPNSGRPPYIGVNSYGFLGSNSFLFEPTNLLSAQLSVVLVRGKHTIKAGLDYRLTRFTEQRPDYSAGRLDFDRAFTRRDYLAQDALSGNAIASLLIGAPSAGRIDYNVFPYFQNHYIAPWIQDEIKLTHKLSINAGLRWDLNTALTERFHQLNRGFQADAVNPLTSRIDKTPFPNYQVKGGLGFVNNDNRAPFNPGYNN